eukprot:6352693-Amphidinium_carterae.1
MLAEIFDYRAKQKVDETKVADGVKLAVACAKQKVDETRVADGVKLAVEIYSDSSAARAIAMKKGTTAKTKHLALRQMHCQDYFTNPLNKLCKVAGTCNPADLFTKAVTQEVLRRLRPTLGLKIMANECHERETNKLSVRDAVQCTKEFLASSVARCIKMSRSTPSATVCSLLIATQVRAFKAANACDKVNESYVEVKPVTVQSQGVLSLF